MRAPVLLVVALVLPGCLGASTGSTGLRSFDEGAMLRGVVTDDELLPVAGATVRISDTGPATTTDATGHFELASISPGLWTVSVLAEGHAPANHTIHLQEGDATEVHLTVPRLASIRPYELPFPFEGHYDCAHEVPIWTGDCMILYKSATGQNDTQTAETFRFRLPVEAGWETVLLELVWTQAPNNRLDGMRIYLENANGTDVGHSYKVGRAEGPQNPLRLVVNRGEPHPRADRYSGTETPAFIPDAGELTQIRVFPRGNMYEQTSQVCDADGKCLLGVGAGLSIDFTIHATVFYHARAPEGFSGIPDG